MSRNACRADPFALAPCRRDVRKPGRRSWCASPKFTDCLTRAQTYTYRGFLSCMDQVGFTSGLRRGLGGRIKRSTRVWLTCALIVLICAHLLPLGFIETRCQLLEIVERKARGYDRLGAKVRAGFVDRDKSFPSEPRELAVHG